MNKDCLNMDLTNGYVDNVAANFTLRLCNSGWDESARIIIKYDDDDQYDQADDDDEKFIVGKRYNIRLSKEELIQLADIFNLAVKYYADIVKEDESNET